MRMPHRALGALALALAGVAQGATLRAECVEAADAGAGTAVRVLLESGPGEAVAAAQFDLLFDASALACAGIAAGEAAIDAGKDVVSHDIGEGHTRVIVSGLNLNTMADGAVAVCSLAVSPAAPDGRYPLGLAGVLLASPSGAAVPALVEPGCVRVGEVPHSADQDGDWRVVLSELLRVIQLYNARAYHCAAGSEDGYNPGTGDQTCLRHASDYGDGGDWRIQISELLRLIQFYNSRAYHVADGTEDGYAPGAVA